MRHGPHAHPQEREPALPVLRLHQGPEAGLVHLPLEIAPRPEIEAFVVDQVRAIGNDTALLADTLDEIRPRPRRALPSCRPRAAPWCGTSARHNAELRDLAGRLATNGKATDRVADLQDRIRAAEQRSTQVREELIALEREIVDENEVARALAMFDPVWETLTPREQARVVRLLVQRVDYDGEKGTVSVTFHPAGIRVLSREFLEAVR